MFVWNCGSADSRDIPESIKVKAIAKDGYHIHAKLLYYPANPIRFICTGVFGDGLKVREEVLNDIPESGTVFPIKKRMPGICQYRFNFAEIACTKSKTYAENGKNIPEAVPIGALDTTLEESTFAGDMFRSKNKILDGFLHIEVKGEKSLFWGCKNDCENAKDFGVDGSNQSMSIECMEGA
jgi:hypothetical protein